MKVWTPSFDPAWPWPLEVARLRPSPLIVGPDDDVPAPIEEEP